MRMTQIRGLNDKAEQFLSDNANRVPSDSCPTCHRTSGGEIIKKMYDGESGVNAGMFDDGPELFEYDLIDGRNAREIVQAVPWSSGPCIFLCLEVNGKRMFEWSDDELNDA